MRASNPRRARRAGHARSHFPECRAGAIPGAPVGFRPCSGACHILCPNLRRGGEGKKASGFTIGPTKAQCPVRLVAELAGCRMRRAHPRPARIDRQCVGSSCSHRQLEPDCKISHQWTPGEWRWPQVKVIPFIAVLRSQRQSEPRRSALALRRTPRPNRRPSSSLGPSSAGERA